MRCEKIGYLLVGYYFRSAGAAWQHHGVVIGIGRVGEKRVRLCENTAPAAYFKFAAHCRRHHIGAGAPQNIDGRKCLHLFNLVEQYYLEAARIDGCGEFRAFFKIVVPLNVPVYTTVILLYFIGTYNDLYGPALYVTEKKDWLMANSISIFENLYKSGSSSYIVPWNYVSVACIIAMLPVVLLFSFMQKQFLESVTGTGLKG